MSERNEKVDAAKAEADQVPVKVEIPTRKLNQTQHFTLFMWATTNDARPLAAVLDQVFQQHRDPPPQVECPPFPPEFCSGDSATVARLKAMVLSVCLAPGAKFDEWLRNVALHFGAALK